MDEFIFFKEIHKEHHQGWTHLLVIGHSKNTSSKELYFRVMSYMFKATGMLMQQ